MAAVEPIVVVLMFDRSERGLRVVARLLIAMLQERLEVRSGVLPQRVRQEAARLHPRHVGRVVEGRLRQLHHLGALAGERDEPVQHRVPARCVAKARVGGDESGDQRLPPMGLDQPALGRVDVGITFVVERGDEFFDRRQRRGNGQLRFATRFGDAWLGLRSVGQLVLSGRADVDEHGFLARPERPVVGPRLRQTQATVRASDGVGVVIVLPIVLPVAHLADVVFATIHQRQAAAARAPLNHSRALGRPQPRPQHRGTSLQRRWQNSL